MCVLVIASNILLLLAGGALPCGVVPEQRGEKDPWFFGLKFVCFCVSAA